ncbi:MAG TPA: chemotaxis protein CheD [Gemmatimonadales bacterium]|nr:chemotaxis protein CheD [Gemmatimonadales bacterium]
MTARERIVRVADLEAGTAGDVLITVALGSCVGIMLYDTEARVGGLAHVLLPTEALSRREQNPAKCPQTAVPHLLERMAALGAQPRRTTARIAGGASMFAGLSAPGTIQMGERNLVATRQALGAHGIALLGEDAGADYGRTVRFRLSDGQIEILSVAHGIRVL